MQNYLVLLALKDAFSFWPPWLIQTESTSCMKSISVEPFFGF